MHQIISVKPYYNIHRYELNGKIIFEKSRITNEVNVKKNKKVS